jgi:hypothetical protein
MWSRKSQTIQTPSELGLTAPRYAGLSKNSLAFLGKAAFFQDRPDWELPGGYIKLKFN